MRTRTINQVKLYDSSGKELLLIENHNGAFALKLLDETCVLRRGVRVKQDKPSFIMIDELQQFN